MRARMHDACVHASRHARFMRARMHDASDMCACVQACVRERIHACVHAHMTHAFYFLVYANALVFLTSTLE